MRNAILFLACCVVISLVYVISSSSASMGLSIVTLLLGLLFALFFCKKKNYADMMTVLFVSFIVVTLATTLQYLANMANYLQFADNDNDHFKFYLASQEGLSASSLNQIFHECVIQNIHYENGGYYFFIKALSYLSKIYADGNHMLLQQLGTALPCILSSVVIYAILYFYCPPQKVRKYTCLFIVFSPLILHSVGIHRDAFIAFFYFVLIYLWLCKEFNLRIALLEVTIAIILYFFREQHGLFAISFLVVSSLSSQKRQRWVYVLGVVLLGAIVGISFLINTVQTSFVETSTYYTNYGADALSDVSSGIGRFVYMLPFPLREIAQIIFLQLRFPPWLALSKATNIYSIVLGVLSFAVSVYWFYVFLSSVISMNNVGFKNIPRKILYGLFLLFVFLFLNSSNLDSRRVVCMFPLLYVAYVYYREYLVSSVKTKRLEKKYIMIYASVCMTYLMLKFFVG